MQKDIKDSRIGITTISNVKISKDFSYLKIFITFLNKNTKKEIKNTIKILQNAENFIRKLLSIYIYLRKIPKLIFIYDESLTEGIKISNVIDKAIKKDKLYRNIIFEKL